MSTKVEYKTFCYIPEPGSAEQRFQLKDKVGKVGLECRMRFSELPVAGQPDKQRRIKAIIPNKCEAEGNFNGTLYLRQAGKIYQLRGDDPEDRFLAIIDVALSPNGKFLA